ncbi:hypothetical protein V1512DRAFT_234332 [Lipomyces arxii]|uniref:uncharacterized protein n=1 Tax=Lipomyces arxii TaxID=56418 RepID=UPI0034CF6755
MTARSHFKHKQKSIHHLNQVADPIMTSSPTSSHDQDPDQLSTADNVKQSEDQSSTAQTETTQSSIKNDVHEGLRFDAAIDVIKRQFDLEILLKHRELSSIEDEIAKVYIMMVQLRRCAGKTVSEDEPDEFARHYAQYLLPDRRYSDGGALPSTKHDRLSGTDSVQSDSSSTLDTPAVGRSRTTPFASRMHLPQYSASGTVGGNTPPAGCIYRRSDGILVRLICKNCSRTTFGSAQGFINHCRISHGREFTSHDNAAQCCGEELDEADQDDIGLGAIKHRRHIQMSSPAGLSLFNNTAMTPTPTPTIYRVNGADDSNLGAKRDYGTKSYPWNYTASSTTFIDQPITPPNESHLDEIPRQSQTVLIDAMTKKIAPSPVGSPVADQSSSAEPTLAMAAPPPPTRHLSNLLKRKQVDVDLDHMAAESVKRDPRGHLFPGEEDVSDDEEDSRLPSVAKFKKLAAGHRGRPLGSGIRILANFH